MVNFEKRKHLVRTIDELILSGDMFFPFGKYARKNLRFKDVDYLELDRYLAWCEDQPGKTRILQELIQDLTRYLSQDHIEAAIRGDLEGC